MPVVPKIDIVESVEDLKKLMKEQKSSLAYAKVQSLYFLKMREVETVRHLAVSMGREERTIHRWLSFYRKGGIDRLLSEGNPPRIPKKISVEEVALLPNELKDPVGFTSYKEIYFWLSVVREISVSYTTVYRLVRQELGSSIKST